MNKTMEELVKQLNEYADQYYKFDAPIVSDKQYDELYDELVRLEKQTGIVLSDSPTRRVGGEPLKDFQKHTHVNRLYSLDKCNSFEELTAWYDKLRTTLGYNPKCTLEYKLDGLTLCLTYDNGELVCASTRGNGIIGEEVTAQVATIRSVPLKIAYKGLTEVKGEGIMRISALEKYNATAEVPLKNPRNAVAGAIRNLDPKVTAKRNLDLVFYDVNYFDKPLSQSEQLDFLKSNGFKTEKCGIFESAEEIVEYIKQVKRNELDFAIDGMVIKVDDPTVRENLGYTDKFPRWAIAYKFEADETTTILRDCIWQVGRTGKLTPLAVLEPVDLCGATISRATLNNYGDILRKGVKIGSRVLLRRSNDVIPEILGVTEDGGVDIPKPKNCPACGSELHENGAHLFCENFYDCPPQIIARLKYFADKGCMDIDGVRDATATQLFEVLNVRSITQYYDLTADDLKKIDGFKDKKIANFLTAVQNSKKANLPHFINALSIPNVGSVCATTLAEKYGSIDALKAASVEELTAIENVGEVTAKAIKEYFEVHNDVIEKFKELGIDPKYDKIENGAFSGMKVVLTGSLSIARSEAAKLIQQAGGIVQSAVSKDTTLVVVGENAGSKLAKAQKLGIKIIDEVAFKDMLNA